MLTSSNSRNGSTRLLEYTEMHKDIELYAELLRRSNVNAIAFSCTAGSFILGPGADQEIINRISKVAPECKATTTSTAVAKAFDKLNITNIAIATPYPDEINALEQKFFEAKGVKVVNIKGLGLTGTETSNLSYEGIRKFVKSVNVLEADGVFISCTGLRAVDVLDILEHELMKPVITSTQATMWDMLTLANIHGEMKNFGKLLAKY